MRQWSIVTALLLGMTLPPAIYADDLAAAAAREKQRRSKMKASAPAKTYSDADLGKAGALANDPSIPPAAGAEAPTSGDVARAPEGTRITPPTSERGESYWRTRARQLHAAVAAAEARVQSAERSATGPVPQGDYKVPCEAGRVLRPDGSLGPVLNPCTGGLAHDRAVAGESALAAARQALEQAQQALTRFEEEARKAGALPGWLR
jgi:hypothetical protein